jgi:hypothetical protein
MNENAAMASLLKRKKHGSVGGDNYLIGGILFKVAPTVFRTFF